MWGRKKKTSSELIVSSEPTEDSTLNELAPDLSQSDTSNELVNLENTPKVYRQGPWIHPFPIITGLSIAGLLVAIFFGNILINRFSDQLSQTDYFHSPPNLAQLITDIQKSTMVITCGKSQGSGWVIALGEVLDTVDPETKALDKEYPGSVITNHHVIEDCIKNKKGITTSNGGETYDSVLFSYDEENDLAIVSTKLLLPPLPLSKKPVPGWWSMALGSPFGIEKSISIGNVMNIVDDQIISTAPINPGNSGGPLVNSFGEIIGTNTWKLEGADGINVAMSVQLLCEVLVNCLEPFWP
jgi:S1-C subfamily serine protease